ncbi:hypothetical protein [Prescottella agglutinans]|uniref:hypothetical protein n=1 Tax=Prescottella agglutinans TaxID=1644129 RepID=UPI001F4D78B6|nr:hypothetical protein [Prescottella agglutinans]
MLAEHDRRFLGREGEIFEGDIRDVAVESQFLEGERWFEASAHDDAKVLRWGPEEFFQIGQRIGVVEQVRIVQDEPHRFVEFE